MRPHTAKQTSKKIPVIRQIQFETLKHFYFRREHGFIYCFYDFFHLKYFNFIKVELFSFL